MQHPRANDPLPRAASIAVRDRSMRASESRYLRARGTPTLPAHRATGTIEDTMSASITELLRAAKTGDESAKGKLFESLYSDLRERAANLTHAQRADHTLEATALVHEAYLHVARQSGAHWADRTHFLAVAATAVRRVLVDHARGQGGKKRDGEVAADPLDSVTLEFGGRAIDLIALDDALQKLEARDPRAARVVELRFFGGLAVPETATIVGMSSRAVERDWEVARAWLYRELQ